MKELNDQAGKIIPVGVTRHLFSEAYSSRYSPSSACAMQQLKKVRIVTCIKLR